MQIPLSYAEDIIGIGGANIAYIRRTSGAILTVQESRGLPDEITVEIKGTSSQVQTAQQLIQVTTLLYTFLLILDSCKCVHRSVPALLSMNVLYVFSMSAIQTFD